MNEIAQPHKKYNIRNYKYNFILTLTKMKMNG